MEDNRGVPEAMSGSSRLNVLAVTTLFPSNVDPTYAPFNRLQFGALAKLADVSVLGVVPWRYGRWYARGSSRDVVREEIIDSLRVRHPRYPSIPGVPSLNAVLMAGALLPSVVRQVRQGRPDVILASYGYPDGCACVALGALLGIPVVVKCHGSDLNRVPDDALAGFQIRRLLKRAGAVVVVSRNLMERARALGIAEARLRVVYNGIDRDRFQPSDQIAARRRLGLPEDGQLVLYLGHLAEHKGVLDLVEAARTLRSRRPRATVLFVGDGPLSARLRGLSGVGRELAGTIQVHPTVPHADVPSWMAAADIFCLPSWGEGMPNVVREAHACGRPVVATRVGGIPEAVHSPQLGWLVPPRDPASLAQALVEHLGTPALPPRALATLAEVPSWEDSARELHAILTEVAGGGAAGRVTS
jgi:teichuronic acid biosynthesis glycosyltransferase TuaC